MKSGLRHQLAEKMAGEITLSDSPGKALKKWRMSFDIPQGVLAERLEVSPSVISDYESGRRKSPGTAVVGKIVDRAHPRAVVGFGFSVLAIGAVFGLFGLFFSAALLVVIYTLIRSLYLRDTLGEDIPRSRHRTLFDSAGNERDSPEKLD